MRIPGCGQLKSKGRVGTIFDEQNRHFPGDLEQAAPFRLGFEP